MLGEYGKVCRNLGVGGSKNMAQTSALPHGNSYASSSQVDAKLSSLVLLILI